jgi:hypothetical protein
MHQTNQSAMQQSGLTAPVRNRYFYGKLLDVYHFELETDYFNRKRWLLNRLISGYGVVCGLNVEAGPEKNQVRIAPGVAIDKWGREIIVVSRSEPLTIPPDLLGKAGETARHADDKEYHPPDDDENEKCIHVVICYHECESDPTPVMAGDCGDTDLCTPGMLREQYRIEFREGCAPEVELECRVPDLILNRKINYPTLAQWITEGCPDLPQDPCLPLANIHIKSADEGHGCDQNNIDITIRPIVYSNDLLFDMVLALTQEEETHKPWSK